MVNNYSTGVVKTYYSYGLTHANLLFSKDFSSLKQLSPEKRLGVIKALCALSKFTGRYQTFKQLMKAYDLTWSTGNKDALILRRLLRPRNQDNDIKQWIQTVKEQVSRLSVFMDFAVTTGLRKVECINSHNLIIDLAEKDKLNEYLGDDNTLEHFRFHKIFLRRKKRVFVSYVPKKLISEVACSPKISEDIINKLLARRHIPVKFADVREYWATAMTRFLSSAEVDFLQGRLSSSTFLEHYYNPTLVRDLKERTLNGVESLAKNDTKDSSREQANCKSVSVTYSNTFSLEYCRSDYSFF